MHFGTKVLSGSYRADLGERKIMTFSVVTRWTTPNVAASTEIAKRSRALWIKHGAQDARLNQIMTGEYTGQLLYVVVFADMATYAKSSATMNAGADLAALVAENTKLGAVMQERTFLAGAAI